MELLIAFMVAEAVVFAGVLIVSFCRDKKDKRIEMAFAGRQSRSGDEFYAAHFQQQGIPKQVVIGVKRILEEHLEADLSRLQDLDDFSTNLAFFWQQDSMADVEIVIALEREFNITIGDEEAAKASTVRAIVELVWRKLTDAKQST